MKLLFVCMGNICRSPTAHGVFRKLVEDQQLHDRIEVDSAGTHAYHVGEKPDRRSAATALARGIDISDLKARQFKAKDFKQFDLILCMDQQNFNHVISMASNNEHEAKVKMMLSFHPNPPHIDVPDPYYGGSAGFERVLDLVEVASERLLEQVKREMEN